MTRSTKLLLAGVALLGLANMWSLQSGGGTPRASARAAPTALRVEDFRLTVGSSIAKPSPGRDLFQLRRVSVPAPAPVKVRAPVVSVALPPPPLPEKTPEQLAEEAARVDLGTFKLVGIVVRGGIGEAFLVRNEQAIVARRGDTVDGRFVVDAVHADHVVLRDPKTKVQGSIQVAGK